jgi:hypothetical protein
VAVFIGLLSLIIVVSGPRPHQLQENHADPTTLSYRNMQWRFFDADCVVRIKMRGVRWGKRLQLHQLFISNADIEFVSIALCLNKVTGVWLPRDSCVSTNTEMEVLVIRVIGLNTRSSLQRCAPDQALHDCPVISQSYFQFHLTTKFPLPLILFTTNVRI